MQETVGVEGHGSIPKSEQAAPREGAFVEVPHPLLGEPWVSAGEVCLDQDLPMQVWIRGDEPYAGQFTMDADEVMDILGIKRSRLTQISGRELRVGRARRNKHVRPVYRPEDVHRYRDWSRATATAVKSSSAIELAANKLDAVAAALPAELDEKLREQWNAVQGILQTQFVSGLSGLRADQCEAFASLRQHLVQTGGQAHLKTMEQLDCIASEQRSVAALLLKILDDIREKQNAMAALILETRQLASAAVAMTQATQVAFNQDLPQNMARLFKEAAGALVGEAATTLLDRLRTPPVRPKRRSQRRNQRRHQEGAPPHPSPAQAIRKPRPSKRSRQ